MNSTAVSIEELLGVEYLRLVETVIGVLSILLNALLLYLNLWRTPKELKEYLFFLIHMTGFDLFLDVIIVFLIHPVTVFPLVGGIILGPLKLLGPELGGSVSLFLAVYAVATSTALVTLAFMYRYVCVVHANYRAKFMGWKVLGGLYLLGNVFTLGSSFSTLLSRSEHARFLTNIYVQFPQTWPLLDDACLIGFDGPMNYVFLGFATTGITITTMANTCIATSIIKHLRSFRASMSETTYKMHMELTVALTIQAISPIILLGIPIGVLIAGLYITSLHFFLTPAFGSFVILMISLHPVVNAVSTLYFVKPYRRVILEMICKLRMKKRIFMETASSTQTTQGAIRHKNTNKSESRKRMISIR